MKKNITLLKQYFTNLNTSFNRDEKLVLLLVSSIFLPYILTYLIVIGISLYFLIKPKLFNQLKTLNGSLILLILVIYAAIISYLNQNHLGLLTSIGMLFIFLAFTFYRSIITRPLFEKAIELMIFMSILSVIFALLQHTYYVISFENFTNFFLVHNKPEYRVKVFYLNANYYALIILYVQTFCIYKLLKTNLHKKYYLSAFFINCIALYFTGSRVALVCLLIVLLFMFFMNKRTKYLKIAGGFILVVVIASLAKIPVIPRLIERGFDLGRRSDIYKTAQIMLEDNFVFGRGPSTYTNFFYQYLDDFSSKYGEDKLHGLGVATQHSHSMFLEIPLSYGIIGVMLLLAYFIKQLTTLFKYMKIKENFQIGVLILSAFLITLLTNIIDFPIFWIQTGLLFFIIISSIEIFKKETN